MNNRKQIWLENGIYLLIWSVILLAPIFTYNGEESFRWNEIVRFWIDTIPLIVLFLVNNYCLVPQLLIKKKYARYSLAVALVIALFLTASSLMHKKPGINNPPPRTQTGMTRNGEFRPKGPPEKHWHDDAKRPPRPLVFRWKPIVGEWILALLLIGFNIAVKFVFKSMRDEQQLKELEKQSLQTELNYLKAQINPHFFMNTLNNIHALIGIDAQKAQSTVIELSRIMRYVLYDTDKATVSLQKEIDFLENYISLMQIRYTREVSIRTVYPAAIPAEVAVPPLMLITLIENAFKHGISYQNNSFIYAELSLEEERLTYTVHNSLLIKTNQEPGKGLENLRKRLTLLYKDRFSFHTTLSDNGYTASLSIPLER